MVEFGRCPRCGHLMLPVLDRSPCGHPDEPMREALTAVGEVYSWTTSHLAPDGPTVLAIADFFEGRLRVTAPVLDAGEVAIGDSVVIVPGSTTPYALRIVGD